MTSKLPQAEKIYIAIASVLILGVLLFVLRNGFVWDDIYFIGKNENIGEPSSLIAALTQPFWDTTAYHSEQLTDLYRPVMSFVLALWGIVFGKWALAFHGLSLIALLGAALALARLVERIVLVEHRRVIGFTMGAIFAIHPLSAEVLCMVANVSDHLALCFLLLGITYFFDYFEDPSDNRRLIRAALFGFLASASKEFGVTFLIAPLIAFSLLRSISDKPSAGTLRSVPLWLSATIPVGLYLALRFAVLHNSEATPFLSNGMDAFSAQTVLLGMGTAFVQSLGPLPTGAHVYVDPGAIESWLGPLLFFVALAAVIVKNQRHNMLVSVPLVGLALAVILLLPSLVIISEYAIGYRYPTRYFHLFLAGLLVAISPVIAAKWHAGLRVAVPITLALFTLLTWMRIDEWRDELSFSLSEAHYHPNSALELQNKATAFINAKAFTQAEETLQQLKQAPDIRDPRHASHLLFLMSEIAIRRDADLERGTELLERALSIKPDNLGYVYALALTRALDKHLDQALIILQKARAAPWFNAKQKETIDRHMDHLITTFGKKNEG